MQVLKHLGSRKSPEPEKEKKCMKTERKEEAVVTP